MSITIEIFQLIGRDWLKNLYLKSFQQFHDCCGVCWCCVQMRAILDEFEKRGFDIFNFHVNCWKVYNNLNHFEISPCFD